MFSDVRLKIMRNIYRHLYPIAKDVLNRVVTCRYPSCMILTVLYIHKYTLVQIYISIHRIVFIKIL